MCVCVRCFFSPNQKKIIKRSIIACQMLKNLLPTIQDLLSYIKSIKKTYLTSYSMGNIHVSSLHIKSSTDCTLIQNKSA